MSKTLTPEGLPVLTSQAVNLLLNQCSQCASKGFFGLVDFNNATRNIIVNENPYFYSYATKNLSGPTWTGSQGKVEDLFDIDVWKYLEVGTRMQAIVISGLYLLLCENSVPPVVSEGTIHSFDHDLTRNARVKRSYALEDSLVQRMHDNNPRLLEFCDQARIKTKVAPQGERIVQHLLAVNYELFRRQAESDMMRETFCKVQ